MKNERGCHENSNEKRKAFAGIDLSAVLRAIRAARRHGLSEGENRGVRGSTKYGNHALGHISGGYAGIAGFSFGGGCHLEQAVLPGKR